jgi:phosphoglycerate dehydrogenase-like enzyme
MRIVIASYIEPDHVERIRHVDPRLEVVYEPTLLPAPRYAADHTGGPFERSAADEETWLSHLANVEVLFDFDRTHFDDLPECAPHVRWIQATSAGIGQLVHRLGYARSMPDTIFTTASGVHAIPLAEFCLMTMMAFRKRLLGTLEDQRRHHWERYAGTDLAGRRVVLVGVGSIGIEVARMARAFGMRTVGVKRTVDGIDPNTLHLDALFGFGDLRAALAGAEHLVLAAPHTPETEGLIGEAELALLASGAVVVNVSRGALLDQAALVDALQTGHLAGAALDVFAEEPLPGDSPLWDMPNVIVSPHSASTSDRENGRITDLFCENLRRYLAGEPLLNVLDTDALY